MPHFNWSSVIVALCIVTTYAIIFLICVSLQSQCCSHTPCVDFEETVTPAAFYSCSWVGVEEWDFPVTAIKPPALSPSSPTPHFSFLHMFSGRQCDCRVFQASCSCRVMALSLFPHCGNTLTSSFQLLLLSYLVTPCVCLLPELCNNNHSPR